MGGGAMGDGAMGGGQTTRRTFPTESINCNVKLTILHYHIYIYIYQLKYTN